MCYDWNFSCAVMHCLTYCVFKVPTLYTFHFLMDSRKANHI